MRDPEATANHKNIHPSRAGFLLCTLALLVLGSCSPESVPLDPNAIDLVALYQTGNARSETRTFVSPGSNPKQHFIEGWSDPMRYEKRECVAALSNEADLAFVVVSVEDKRLAFDVSLHGPQRAPETQQISVSIGEHLLRTVALSGTADTHIELDLPADFLVRGENHLRWTFAEVQVNPTFATDVISNFVFPSIAAYFSNFQLSAAHGDHAPRPNTVAFQYSPEQAVLQQKGPSFVEHAFKLTKAANLAIEGTMSGEGGAAVVEYRREGATAWRQLKGVTGHFQKRFRLEANGGEIGQIRLTVSRGECAWSFISLGGVAAEPRYAYVDRPAMEFRHVVLIVLDALRSDMLAVGGGQPNLAPNLNRLAEQAVVFANATSASSLTPTSVYSYFTGENPYSAILMPDYENNTEARPVMQLASFDLAAAFSAAGCRTINIAGNFYLKKDHKLAVSFGEDHFIWPDVAENDRSPRTSGMDQGPVLKAIDEMARSEVPVMLYLHYLPPHLPYNPPEGFRGFLTGNKASRVAEFPSKLTWLYDHGLEQPDDPQLQEVFNQYKENAHYADALVGEVFEALSKEKLAGQTLVIVIADHGEAFLEHGKFKHSSTVYDEMIRVPMMFIHPSFPHMTVSEHVGLIDLVPTLVELFGLPCNGNKFDGRSLWPLLMREGAAWEDRWYFSVAAEKGTHFGYRTDKLKYIYSGMRDQLFDLKADPAERHTIHETAPLLTAWLRQKGQMEIYRASQRRVEGDGGEMDESGLRNLRDLGYIR